jgi:seryl-tRNA synthetase
MLDINLIREKPEWVKEQVAKLNDTAPIDEILAEDTRRREILQEVEELRRQRNESSKQIGRWMGSLKKLEADLRRSEAGQDVGQSAAELRTQINSLQFNADEAKDETRRIGERIAELDDERRQVEADLREHMLWVPNIPHESVPVGPDDSHNVIYEPKGAPEPQFRARGQNEWQPLLPAQGMGRSNAAGLDSVHARLSY